MMSVCVYACIHACVCIMFRSSFKSVAELTTASLKVTVDDGWHGEDNPVAIVDDRVHQFVLDNV